MVQVRAKKYYKRAYTKHVANVDDMLHVPLVLTAMERHYEESIIMGLTLRVFTWCTHVCSQVACWTIREANLLHDVNTWPMRIEMASSTNYIGDQKQINIWQCKRKP